jgi:hypothetical protein
MYLFENRHLAAVYYLKTFVPLKNFISMKILKSIKFFIFIFVLLPPYLSLNLFCFVFLKLWICFWRASVRHEFIWKCLCYNLPIEELLVVCYGCGIFKICYSYQVPLTLWMHVILFSNCYELILKYGIQY